MAEHALLKFDITDTFFARRGSWVLSEFLLEELAIVGNVQCEKLDPPHPSLIKRITVYCLSKGNKGPKNCGCTVLSENAKIVAKWPGKTLTSLERCRGFQPGGVLS